MPPLRLFLALIALLAPLTLQADVLPDGPLPGDGPTLDAAAFEAYVTGKTLTYAQYGEVFGTEEYLSGRRVRWSVAVNHCQYGTWYQKADMICFTYEDDSDENCWRFWQNGAGLTARAAEDTPGAELTEVGQTTHGLSCPAPDVGV